MWPQGVARQRRGECRDANVEKSISITTRSGADCVARPSVRPAAADRRRRVSHVVRHSNYATQLRHDARDDDDDDDAEMTELQLLAGTAVFSKLEDIHFSHISILSSDY